MVVIVLALAVVVSFVLGYVLGRHTSTPHSPGRHSAEYFAKAAETTLELAPIYRQ